MGQAAYRFLPWARRGLSTMIAAPDIGQDLVQRPSLAAGLTVSGAGSHGVDLSLYGPADIIGIDSRLIIRTDPKPHTTDCEPNYLAAIEFDLPELPWLFSPASADAQQHLRPWLVLVVLETTGEDRVASPRVEQGRPLPVIELAAQQVAGQLPDLSQSWAWAHGQLLSEKGSSSDNSAALAGDPNLNLSRIVCPRRLEPMTGYMACLVPAFDLGVLRGLGATPPSAAVLKPAWRIDQPADLTLPVYFHWNFATGPQGDFESLARELKPFKCPPTVGTTSMFIWDSLPGLFSATPTSVQDKPVWMDGALRASEGEPATMADIDPAFQQAITKEVNSPADIADLSAPDSTRAIAAPVYGGFHAKAVRVPAANPKWLKEINLDPRARAAAGLAADVVRTNQEILMQSCWEQVGKVLEANALLNQSWLATAALTHLHGRISALSAASQLMLTAPVRSRVNFGSLTIAANVTRSSLPNASLSPTFRRMLSPRRPALRHAARALATSPATGLMERMARGSSSVDPNQFTPDGLDRVRAFDSITVGNNPAATIDLSVIGLTVLVRAQDIEILKHAAGSVALLQPPVQVRADIIRTGIVTNTHIGVLAGSAAATSLVEAIDEMISTAGKSPRAEAFLLDRNSEGKLSIAAIDIASDGQAMLRTPSGSPDRVIANFGNGFSGGATSDFTAALTALPKGILGSALPVTITKGNSGEVMGGSFTGVGRSRRFKPNRPVGEAQPIADLVKDSIVLDKYSQAFAKTFDKLEINQVDRPLQIVPFDLAGAASAIAVKLDPRRTVTGRLASMIQLNGIDLFAGSGGTATVVPTVDRILCAPSLPEPAYLRLARYDSRAFLPGIDTIPQNTLTLLETNPRFIEAYMVGLNHEMNRELLWRRYPTDQRGTPFRHFWDWEDGAPDIGQIHAFANKPLGHNTRGGEIGGNLVLLVRGNLLRRYPNSTISAWRGVPGNGRPILMPNPGPTDYRPAVFFGGFEPDVSFAGFSLTRPEIVAGEGWFFVIEQQVTEPRFGFDEEKRDAVAANPGNWRDARWIDTGTNPGGHLAINGRLAGHQAVGVTYAKDAAHLAAAAMQRPFRLAVHASNLTQF